MCKKNCRVLQVKRRTFIKTAAGIFVPTIVGLGAMPSHRRIASRSVTGGGEPASPTTDPALGGFWRSDTALYEGSGADAGKVRSDAESIPRGWHDQGGDGNHFVVNNSGGGPAITASLVNGKPGLTFPGGGSPCNFLTSLIPVASTAQPLAVFLLLKITAFTANRWIMDTAVGSPSWCAFYYTANANEAQMSAGLAGPTGSIAAYVGSWVVLSLVFDTTSSFYQFNNDATVTGSVGTRDYQQLVIGSSGSLLSSHQSSFQMAAGTVSLSAPSAATRNIHKNWLAWYGGLTI
jgi:hypothetical protein